MQWIALQWQPEKEEEAALPTPQALGWWALQFTPRAAWVDEALLLEVSACERMWGGRRPLMREIARLNPAAPLPLRQAQGATSLVALARLRLYGRGIRPPAEVPGALPLDTLSAATDHLEVLEHMGCRTWGDLAALPRGGLARRFGAALRAALDRAWGLQPDGYEWLTLPDVFDQKLELHALATTAPELLWYAGRLLGDLQLWLRMRQRGVLAFTLEWTLDLKRLNGVDLPRSQQVTIRTAEPTQDMKHLRRLLGERLAQTTLAAPTGWLRLRSLDTVPWGGSAASFLPEDNRPGDRLHQLVERLGARLGPQQVLRVEPRADHRFELQQQWLPASTSTRSGSASAAWQANPLYPPWLLREPLPLEVRDRKPYYQGLLQLRVGPWPIETGWWGGDGGRALRDCYIAESPGAGMVWIWRERFTAPAEEPRWFLQGLYA